MFKKWRRYASVSEERHRRWAGLTTALAVGLASAVAGCPPDASRCAYVIANVGTAAGGPPEDGTPVTLQAVGGQRLYLSMVGGTFTYGSQRSQTSQCVPVPAGDQSIISFTVLPDPSGEATLRVDLLGDGPACSGGSSGSGGAAAIDVGCGGELLDDRILVFVAPVTATSSSGGGGGAGTTSASTAGGTGGTGGKTSYTGASSGTGGSDGG
jgi:hypothetical protein